MKQITDLLTQIVALAYAPTINLAIMAFMLLPIAFIVYVIKS